MAFQQQGKDHLLSIDSISLLMSEIQYLSNSTLTTSRTQHLFNFYENNSSLLSYAHAMAPSHRIHFHRHPIPHATLLTSNCFARHGFSQATRATHVSPLHS